MVDVEEAKVMDLCQIGACRNPAVETHWIIGSSSTSCVCAVCADHVSYSKEFDRRDDQLPLRHLYLPIIQPIVGDENWIAVECFMHAISRLLLACDEKAGAA